MPACRDLTGQTFGRLTVRGARARSPRCARATYLHTAAAPIVAAATAPPSPAMNSRRLICNPQASKSARRKLNFSTHRSSVHKSGYRRMISPCGMRGKGIGFADQSWCRSSLPPSQSSALPHLPLTMAMPVPQTGSRRSVGKSDWRVAWDPVLWPCFSPGPHKCHTKRGRFLLRSTCARLSVDRGRLRLTRTSVFSIWTSS